MHLIHEFFKIHLSPGGSYTDPAERVMPLLNIAMQGFALSRQPMSSNYEDQIKGCNSMAKIRMKSNSDEIRSAVTVPSIEGRNSVTILSPEW